MPQVFRRFWTRPRAVLRGLLAVDDTPHAIAVGAAIGMFIGLTPTVGVQMLVVALLAYLARGWFYFNRAAALAMAYVTNPLTIVPIYWFNYRVGALFVDGRATREELAGVLTYGSFDEWWASVKTLCMTIGEPLLVGSVIVAAAGAAFTYVLVFRLAGSVRPARAGGSSDGPEQAAGSAESSGRDVA